MTSVWLVQACLVWSLQRDMLFSCHLVLVIEKRGHFAGNTLDYIKPISGILINKYPPPLPWL